MSDAITSLPIKKGEEEFVFLDLSDWNVSADLGRTFIAETAPLNIKNVFGFGASSVAVLQTGRGANYFLLEEQVEVSPPFASTAFPKFYTVVLEAPAAEDTSRDIQTSNPLAYFISGDYAELKGGISSLICGSLRRKSLLGAGGVFRVENDWISEVIRLSEIGKEDESLDVIFDNIDEMLLQGRFDDCDSAVSSILIRKFSNAQLITVLTATLPAKPKLGSRREIVRRIRSELSERTSPAVANALLRGLD